jgi:hypothetical protein
MSKVSRHSHSPNSARLLAEKSLFALLKIDSKSEKLPRNGDSLFPEDRKEVCMRRYFAALLWVTISVSLIDGRAKAQQGASGTTTPVVIYADQGWSDAERDLFYTTSQGSHMMPYAWFKALRRLDVDEPFAADQLQRYGYLHNDRPNNPEGLPVGFVIDGDTASGQLGMTCAACHTGQLEYEKDGVTSALRLDGAPANADFQQFLAELTTASRQTLAQRTRFDAFAKAVLSVNYTAAKAAQLKIDFGAWVRQFGDFMDASLPPSSWGPGRLDAFGMIFNRVAARDLGVPGNFKVADAPVSYPFLWNATRQDHTQWNGGVPNGLYIQGLARNTGEVFGVFADFKPKRWFPGAPTPLTIIDFTSNSADFAGLQTLEEKIATLKPPSWPRDVFKLDEKLAERGKPLFEANCGECHSEKMSSQLSSAWITSVMAVGTDPKMVTNAGRASNPGLYSGALMPPPPIGARFKNPAKTGDILAASVVGALLAEAFTLPITPEKLQTSGVWRAIRTDFGDLLPDRKFDDLSSLRPDFLMDLQARIKNRLDDLFRNPGPAGSDAAYEARVLHGIWATAPYLHNGSVPNLWELLTPAKERKSSFMIGSRVFDPKNVGYVTDQSPFKNGKFVTDPRNANGNGNGGHEYGTGLTPDERWAIIEYLKTL